MFNFTAHLNSTDLAELAQATIASDFGKPQLIKLRGPNGSFVMSRRVFPIEAPNDTFRVLTDGITPPRQPATAHIQ